MTPTWTAVLCSTAFALLCGYLLGWWRCRAAAIDWLHDEAYRKASRLAGELASLEGEIRGEKPPVPQLPGIITVKGGQLPHPERAE